ncbi:hypothetical protein [Desulfosarcina cetonica]|uniref:hypothetical protein n=1 Tax=Desulfosarcina cetonica TaxID=90730 RepID=UPI00155DDE8A|nr:hypothetical protein [Desulfosarcina cetonica]
MAERRLGPAGQPRLCFDPALTGVGVELSLAEYLGQARLHEKAGDGGCGHDIGKGDVEEKMAIKATVAKAWSTRWRRAFLPMRSTASMTTATTTG